MSKGKKKPQPPQRAKAASKDARPNLFEHLYNRKKFNVLGKKEPGIKKHGKSLNDAVEKRKKTLLVEYRQLRKANAFVDRRFGEDNEGLTPEEKAIVRFQKQRMSQAGGDKFALAEDEPGGDVLTHFGRSIADDNALGAKVVRPGTDVMEDDAEMDRQMTQQLHFGGGFAPKQGLQAHEQLEGEAPERRTKKEVMEELITKSKSFKAEKQKQRDEDLEETEALDEQFRGLLEGQALLRLMKPKGSKASAAGTDSLDPDGQRYDVMRRELTFEAKGKPSDRSKTAEELAAEEQLRLERLEAHRLKRMRGASGDALEDDGLSEGEGADLPAGGFAARRAKRRRQDAEASKEDRSAELTAEGPGTDEASGSSGEESEEESEEDDGLSVPKKAKQAAGNHPLQRSFRAATAELLGKYGVPVSKQTQAELEAESDGSEEVSGSEEDSPDSSVSSVADDSQGAGAKTDGPAADALLEAEYAGSSSSSEDESAEQSNSESDGDAVEAPGCLTQDRLAATAAKELATEGADRDNEGTALGSGETASKQEQDVGVAASAQPADAATVAAPAACELSEQATEAERQALPAQAVASGRTAAPAAAVEADGSDVPFTLPAPETYEAFRLLVEGRSSQHLALVVQRICAFNAAALAAENRRKMQVFYGILVQHFSSLAAQQPVPLAHLDSLMPQVVHLTSEVPFYAATVARARLRQAQEQLSDALSGASEGPMWPGTRQILLLKLWATVFPVSDKRHPVTTPAALLASSYLSLCPVASLDDVAKGLLLSALALSMAASAQRLVPEPLTFAVRALASATTAPGAAEAWLRPTAEWSSLPAAVAPLTLEALQAPPAEPQGADKLKCSLLLGATRVVQSALAVFGHVTAAAELFQPASAALASLLAESGLPWDLRAAAEQVAAAVSTASQECVAHRQPLVRAPPKRAADIKQFNPKFEEEYVVRKDYDPDRDRAEKRRLQRQLNKERRGAMRELRKDAVFISEERDREKSQAAAERAQAYRKAVSFLEQQEADFKSGGQGGMWKGKKGKR